MKTFKSFALVALTVAAIASCQKPEPEVCLAVTSSEITVPTDGGQQPISFTATDAWTAASDVEWITIDKAAGEAGSAAIKVTVAPNDTYNDRSGKITVTMGEKSFSVKINQTQLDVFSSVVTYNIDAKAQTIVYEVNANVAYSIEVEEVAQSWIAAAVTKAEPSDGKIKIQVAANDLLFAREGKVYITVGNVKNCVIISQSAAFEYMTDAKVTYIGRTADIYDADNYSYFNFNQYVVTLENEEKEVTVVLNYGPEVQSVDALLAGEFTCDISGAREPNTFSLKSLVASEKYYTRIVDKSTDREILPTDGTVKVEDGYTIVVTLQDEAGNVTSYAFEGSVGTIVDEGLGVNVYSSYYRTQYNTYFTTKAKQWDLGFHVSRPTADDNVPLTYVSFTVFGPEDADINSIPDGTYTFDEPENDATIPYNNGKLKAQPFTFTDGYGEYFEGGDGRYVNFNGGTIKVSHNEAGEIVLDLDVTGTGYHYDENYDTVDDGANKYTLTCAMAAPVDTDYYYGPVPDGSRTLTSAGSISYPSFYFPDFYGVGGHAFVVQLSGLSYTYSVYFTIIDDGSYTYEINWNNRYCSNAITPGRYNYSTTAAKMALVPTSGRSTIVNSYTGTSYYTVGGYVDVAKDKITFSLDGKTAAGETATFTGEIDASVMYVRDYSSSTAQKNAIKIVVR